MKKQITLAMCILIALPAQAVDVGKVVKKIVKCSWHLTKIGGGIGCWSVSPIAFGSASLFHKIPVIPEVGNIPADQVRQTLVQLANVVNALINQYRPVIDGAIGRADAQIQAQWQQYRGMAQITPEQIAQGEQWFAANQQAMHEGATAINRGRRWARNMSFLYFIGFLSAGGASIWSGLTGLQEELSGGADPESDLSEFQFAE